MLPSLHPANLVGLVVPIVSSGCVKEGAAGHELGPRYIFPHLTGEGSDFARDAAASPMAPSLAQWPPLSPHALAPLDLGVPRGGSSCVRKGAVRPELRHSGPLLYSAAAGSICSNPSGPQSVRR